MFNFWRSRSAKNIPRCVLLGADCSGKTTLLYMWHLGDVVTTIPTIGFNLETINHSNRTLEVLDFGGCDNLAPMARHYLDSNTGILFLHALNASPERAAQSLELLQMHVGQVIEAGGRYIWVMVTKQDLVPAEELNTKRAELYSALKNILQRFGTSVEWKVFDDPGLNSRSLKQTWPMFDDIAKVLNEQGMVSTAITIGTKYDEKTLKERIEVEAGQDENPEIFWQRFLTADLPQWNHRSHLRAGFLTLLKSASMLEDFWSAVETFLDHINRLRNARPDRFRNTAHHTMTMFWLYVLQLSISEFRNRNFQLPSEDDFQIILLSNPRLADTSYWENYYSRSVMLTPEAKYNWCLPDKKSLPIEVHPHIKIVKNQLKVGKLAGGSNDNDDYQIRLIRFALTVVQQYFATGERRGKIIASALRRLQQTIMQQRASASSTSIEPYSETQAYFWIQIVHATLLPYQLNDQCTSEVDQKQYASLKASSPKGVEQLTYERLSHIFDVKPDVWKQYYSARLWTSIPARMSFIAPDLQQLPNVFPKISSSVIAERYLESRDLESFAVIQSEGRALEDNVGIHILSERSTEETEIRIDIVIAEIEKALMSRNNESITVDQCIAESTISAHAILLFRLYKSLNQSTQSDTGHIDIPQFISCMVTGSTGEIESTGSVNTVSSTLLQDLDKQVKNLSSIQEATSQMHGMTKLLFYARILLALEKRITMSPAKGRGEMTEAYLATLAEPKNHSADSTLADFRSFLCKRSPILFKELPFSYYTPRIWYSLDAKRMFIEPDLKPLPVY